MTGIGKSNRLNHEFLADEAVIQKTNNIKNYQYILLGIATNLNTPGLASSLNYSLTKKRLNMMNSTRSNVRNMLTQTALVPVITVIVCIACLRVQGQDSIHVIPRTAATVPPNWHKIPPQTPFTKEGVSMEILDQYKLAVEKFKTGTGAYNLQIITDSERETLEKIYYSMNREQQLQQMLIFIPKGNVPRPRLSPTEKQMASWVDAKTFGIWIDGKRAGNENLKKYSRLDFKDVYISKLSRAAVDYGKYFYQIDLMTENAYTRYSAETQALTGSYILAGRHEKLWSKNEPE